MPAAVLDERGLALIQDSREVRNVGWPGRDPEVNEQQAQYRLDADPAGWHVDTAVNRPGRDVEVGMTEQPGISGAVRVPVPADQFTAGVVQEVVFVSGRAHVPGLAPVLDKLELMAELELDAPDAGGGELEGVFRKGQGLALAGLPAPRDEQLRIGDAGQGALQRLEERFARFL
jgi:hypothetical protein